MNRYVLTYVLSLGLLGRLIFLYAKRRKSIRSPKDTVQEVNQVLFFPDPEYPCSQIVDSLVYSEGSIMKCYNPSCMKMHTNSSMISLLKYLSEARKSVDLCIYLFTEPKLAKILLQLNDIGVIIRVITDSTENDAINSQLELLKRNGIYIKSNSRETGALMHHKFVLLDDRLLMTGSFNWTSKAVICNYEAVLVSSNAHLVAPFRQKFNEMWEVFEMHQINDY